jgi:hypothetical protein
MQSDSKISPSLLLGPPTPGTLESKGIVLIQKKCFDENLARLDAVV